MSWEIFYGLGALALAAVVAYAMWRNKTRNRANDRITEEATRQEYQHPDSYPEIRKDLERQVKPQ